MKFNKLLIATLFASAILVACRKDNKSNAALEGSWTGRYGFENEGLSEFYSFRIKPDGVLEEYGEAGMKIGTGRWTLENNIFSGYTISTLGSENKYSVIAAFDASGGKLSGNWGFGESTTDGGTWEMQKQ